MGMSTGRGLAAGAIEAAMLAAGPAVSGEHLAQVLAGSMESHRQVILRDAQRRSHSCRVLSLKIDLLKKVAV